MKQITRIEKLAGKKIVSATILGDRFVLVTSDGFFVVYSSAYDEDSNLLSTDISISYKSDPFYFGEFAVINGLLTKEEFDSRRNENLDRAKQNRREEFEKLKKEFGE